MWPARGLAGDKVLGLRGSIILLSAFMRLYRALWTLIGEGVSRGRRAVAGGEWRPGSAFRGLAGLGHCLATSFTHSRYMVSQNVRLAAQNVRFWQKMQAGGCVNVRDTACQRDRAGAVRRSGPRLPRPPPTPPAYERAEPLDCAVSPRFGERMPLGTVAPLGSGRRPAAAWHSGGIRRSPDASRLPGPRAKPQPTNCRSL